MQKLMKAMHKNEKGFTLVELMVVVVIIGILVAIAIPIYGLITARAERSTITANVRIIDGAIGMAIADNAYLSGTTIIGDGTGANDLVGDYIEPIELVGTEAYGIQVNAPDMDRAQVTIGVAGEGALAPGVYTLAELLQAS